MALLIEDDETDRLVRRFAEIKGLGPAEAVKLAIEDQLDLMSLNDRIRPIQDDVRSWPRTGQRADKAFYDSLNGE